MDITIMFANYGDITEWMTLSQLVFGCMHLARDDCDVETQIIYAIEHAVNHFDIAYSMLVNRNMNLLLLIYNKRTHVKMRLTQNYQDEPHFLLPPNL